MTTAAFLASVLVLLLAPGPTNTLIGLAGSVGGWRSAARLIPAEIAGYLTVILPLALVGDDLARSLPLADTVLKAAAAAWVMVLAIGLWSKPVEKEGTGKIGLRRVYLTTVLNPKGLIFGLVLLPQANDPAFPARLALVTLLVTAAAATWAAAGNGIRLAGNGRLRLVQRVASIWLAVVSLSLVAAVLRS